jgi:hypothetical protein
MVNKFNKHDLVFSRSTPSMMDRWNAQKAKLKKKYPNLTDADLRYSEGKRGEMLENLRIKLDVSADNWKKIMKEIESN